MRKAQFGYGWDWGPRLPTIGLFRPISPRPLPAAALADIHFYTLEITADRAAVAIRVDVERYATDAPLTAHISLSGQVTEVPVAGTTGVTIRSSSPMSTRKRVTGCRAGPALRSQLCFF